MNTRWMQASAGVMLAGVAVVLAAGCAGNGPQSASAEPAAVLVFDDEIRLPTQAEADEFAGTRIDERNADAQFEMLASELDRAFYDD
jgi:hypothetical protein